MAETTYERLPENLPTIEDFKKMAKNYHKTSSSTKTLGEAQNKLARERGYRDWNAIKVVLPKNRENYYFKNITVHLNLAEISFYYDARYNFPQSEEHNPDFTPAVFIEVAEETVQSEDYELETGTRAINAIEKGLETVTLEHIPFKRTFEEDFNPEDLQYIVHDEEDTRLLDILIKFSKSIERDFLYPPISKKYGEEFLSEVTWETYMDPENDVIFSAEEICYRDSDMGMESDDMQESKMYTDNIVRYAKAMKDKSLIYALDYNRPGNNFLESEMTKTPVFKGLVDYFHDMQKRHIEHKEYIPYKEYTRSIAPASTSTLGGTGISDNEQPLKRQL